MTQEQRRRAWNDIRTSNLRAFDAHERQASEPGEIKVGIQWSFPQRLWRDAFHFYLTRVWVEDVALMAQPALIFKDLWLQLNVQEDRYHVFSAPTTNLPNEYSEYSEWSGEHLVVSTSRADVENGLIRFVRNNRIRQLSINLLHRRQLRFIKHVERAKLTVELVGMYDIDDDYDNY